MAPAQWWSKSYQPHFAGAATAPIKDCVICGKFASNRCSKCSAVGYCGRDCQIKHWPEHKKECVTLKARALAAAQAKATVNDANGVSPTSSPAPAPATPPSNAAIPIATTELYPYEKFIQNWKSISLSSRVPCGLYNLGNTCYINSILQVLLATRPLIAYLLTNEHTCTSPTTASPYSNTKKQWCPLCCLVSLAKEVFQNSTIPLSAGGTNLNSTRDPLTIRNITHFVHHLNSSFTLGDQHDAQELYVALLDAIECVSLREIEANTEGGAAATAALDQFSKQTTLMNHVFTCYTRTQVECTMCGKVSKSYASDTGIMLSVPEERKNTPYTLENLLENFTAVEILEGDDAYRCDACCARVKAHKSNIIEIAPNILAIQLSRVGMSFFSTGAEMAQKNSAAVEFPLELDLTPFMAVDALDAAPAVYELYGVVTHEGSTTEDGHYISAVRYGGDSCNSGTTASDFSESKSSSSSSLASPLESNENTHQGRWYVCDDDIISPLSVDILLKQQEEAYLLFYERKQPRIPHLLGGSVQNSNGGAVNVNRSPVSGIETVEKLTAATPLAGAEVKPRAANGETEQGEEEEEEENAVSYVFEMEKNQENESRALRLKVRLATVEGDFALQPPQIDIKPGKPVFAEVRCGGCSVLRMPLPVEVALPARKFDWNKDEKILDVLFDAAI